MKPVCPTVQPEDVLPVENILYSEVVNRAKKVEYPVKIVNKKAYNNNAKADRTAGTPQEAQQSKFNEYSKRALKFNSKILEKPETSNGIDSTLNIQRVMQTSRNNRFIRSNRYTQRFRNNNTDEIAKIGQHVNKNNPIKSTLNNTQQTTNNGRARRRIKVTVNL